MMTYIFLFFLCFAFLTWRNLSWGIGIAFFLLPTYLIRFSLGPLPSTLLEGMILILLTIILWKRREYLRALPLYIRTNSIIAAAVLLLLLAAIPAIYISVDRVSALGELKAFYLEPILLGLLLAMSAAQREIRIILRALVLSAFVTSIFAIYQHFTGFMVPWDFWENRNTFRVTGWWGFPNGVGLYLAPLWFVALGRAKEETGAWRVAAVLTIILSPLAIWFAKSTGALIGLAGGIWLLFVLFKRTRRLAITAAVVGALFFFLLPAANPIKQEVLFQDRSGRIRLAMWGETMDLLKDSPLFGAGLASYQQRVAPYHQLLNGEGIEIFHHPHNIFLTMWVNFGILGLIAYTTILVSALWHAGTTNNRHGHILLAVIATFGIMGLVDSPQIKNDMAILFWLVVFLTTHPWRNAGVVERGALEKR